MTYDLYIIYDLTVEHDVHFSSALAFTLVRFVLLFSLEFVLLQPVVVPKRWVWIFSVLSSQYLVIEVGSLITLLHLKLLSFPILTCVSLFWAAFKNVLSSIIGEHSDTNFIFNGNELFTINTRCSLECIWIINWAYIPLVKSYIKVQESFILIQMGLFLS